MNEKKHNPNYGGARAGARRPIKDLSGNAISKTMRLPPRHVAFVTAQQESFTEVVVMALEEFMRNHPERQENNNEK